MKKKLKSRPHISRVCSYAVGLSLMGSLFPSAQAAVWLGITGDLKEASNWSGDVLPGNGEMLEFNGSSSVDSVYMSSTFEGVSSGLGGIILRAGQTSGLTINAEGSSNILRLAGGAGITIESGAGPFVFGNLTQFSSVLNLGGANGTAVFTNNSTSDATFGASSLINRGGSSSSQNVVFDGTGHWDMLGTFNSGLNGFISKRGTGTLYVSKIASTTDLRIEESTATFASTITVLNQLTVGSTAKTATLTLTGGNANVGTGENSNAVIGLKNVPTLAGETSGFVDFAGASSVNFNLNVLDIGKHTSVANTGSGNILGRLTLSKAGLNTIRANQINQGHILSGSTVTARGEIVLGKQNVFYVDQWHVGAHKGIGVTSFGSDVVDGTISIRGNTGDKANLWIGANLSAGTSTERAESSLDLRGGILSGNFDRIVLGAFGTGTGGGKGAFIFDATGNTIQTNRLTLAESGGTTPSKTQGTFRMLGGTFVVAQGVEDGGGLSNFHLDLGTVQVGNGFSVDNVSTGLNSQLTVAAGAVRIGDGAAADHFLLGTRSTHAPSPAVTLADFSSASGVTINVTDLKISHVHTIPDQAPTTTGTLKLSANGTNNVRAKNLWLASVDHGSTGRTTAELLMGKNNTFAVDKLYVGALKGIGSMKFQTTGSQLTLTGATNAGADIYVGWNHSDSTSTNPDESHLDFTGGTVNATIRDMVIGSYGLVGKGSNTGGGKGRVTFEAGLLEIGHLRLAHTLSPDSANYSKTHGSFTMMGGEVHADLISRGPGVASFNFVGGVLKAKQMGEANSLFNLTNMITGTLEHGVDSQIGSTLLYGDYTQGGGAKTRFDLSLTQGNDKMTVHGNIFLGGLLELNTLLGGTELVDSFTLIENLGYSNISGAFTGLAEGHLFELNFGNISGMYQLSYQGGISGRDLVLLAQQIPEPSRVILLLAGAFALFHRRKR